MSQPSRIQFLGTINVRRLHALAIGSIVLAAVIAYWNSFGGAFVYDDVFAVEGNPTIRSIPRSILPPADSGLPTGGRPLVNFSLALNFAISGLDPRSYHAFNLAVHTLAALTLFGLVRRTLARASPGENDATSAAGPRAPLIAAAIALLWTVHPLQTASVTYISQRAEALVGFFYLLTLYTFVRATDAQEESSKRGWLAASVAACLLGMASKEVMVSAPLIVWLYDRTFVAGTFGEAWRRRPLFYVSLALTWALLIALVIRSGDRGGTAGFGAGASAFAYLLNQSFAIIHYLRLCVWPHPLIFDYGIEPVVDAWRAIPFLLVIALLIGATIHALIRRPALGFLGVSFFALLAPSSSFVPVTTELFAEHRMYLPLAIVLVLLVLGGERMLGRLAAIPFAIAAVAFAALTIDRNKDYRSELALWQHTVAHRPGNVRAWFNLGAQFTQRGEPTAAILPYERAIQLKPDFVSARINLSEALQQLGRAPDAVVHAATAVKVAPERADAQASLGNALFQLRFPAEALQHFEAAVRLAPDNPDFRNNLGAVLTQLGRLEEALPHYQRAVELRPEHAETRFYFGNTLARLGRFPEAITQYEHALRIRPDFEAAHDNLARVRNRP